MVHFESWDSEVSDDTTLRLSSDLAKLFFARLGEEGQQLSAILDRREFAALLSTTPGFAADAESYRNYRAGMGMLEKLPSLPLGVDKELVAAEKFLLGEAACRETNYLFNLWSRGDFQFVPRVERILHATQRKILKIVGDVPEPSQVPFRFSPGGASTSTKKKDSEIRTLIANASHCSEELACDQDLLGSILATVPLLFSWLKAQSGDTDSCLLSVTRTRLDFVPKNAKTHRVITVEPDMNKFVQNGYGDTLRVRAKRSGIDLSDQSRNAELARLGSLNDRIATVDLTNASGLMALELIRHLWPNSWMDVLLSIRSGYSEFRGTKFTMQAYAGMGNGTTFPVESITFFCLAEACVEEAGAVGPVSAYGDDLIIPSSAYNVLVEVFQAIGLSVNTDKSFVSGPFRESCGSDWFLGYAVRPAYLRGNLSVRRLFLLHNHYYRVGDEEAASWFLDLIPPSFRIFGPDGYGDGHLLGPWTGKVYYHRSTEKVLARCKCALLGVDHGSECYHETVVMTKTSMYTFKTYAYQPRTIFRATMVDALLPSYSIYSSLKMLTPSEFRGSIAVDRRFVKVLNDHLGVKSNVGLKCAQYMRALHHHDEKPAWFEFPPGTQVWVIGTPMPGTRGSKRTTVATFEKPTLLS